MSDPTFANFMKDVDREVTRISGLGVDDLPDYCFHDAFENEEDPREVARDVLEGADFPF